MKRFFFLTLLSYLSFSCVTGDARIDLCKETKINRTLPGKRIFLQSVNYSSIQNFNKQLKNISELGDLTLTVSDAKMVSDVDDFSWVTHASITIESQNDVANYPPVFLADQDVNAEKVIVFETLLTHEVLEKYFLQGEVRFVYTLTGSVPENIQLTNTLCLDARVNGQKFVTEL